MLLFQVNNIISRKTVNEYKPLLKTGTKNLCEFLKAPEKEPILKMLLGKLKDYGNLEFSCPMPKVCVHYKNLLCFFFSKEESQMEECYVWLRWNCDTIVFYFTQGTFHMEGFHIDGQSLPQMAPTGDYKMELVITRKIDGKQTPVFNMVWFATLALKTA